MGKRPPEPGQEDRLRHPAQGRALQAGHRHVYFVVRAWDDVEKLVYAACADSSWPPSIRFLAKIKEKKKSPHAQQSPRASARNSQEIKPDPAGLFYDWGSTVEIKRDYVESKEPEGDRAECGGICGNAEGGG